MLNNWAKNASKVISLSHCTHLFLFLCSLKDAVQVVGKTDANVNDIFVSFLNDLKINRHPTLPKI